MEGIVIKSTGSWYKVRSMDGMIHLCRIVGKLRLDGIKSTNPVAVGDIVTFELEPQKETGVIKKINPRKNYLIRKSVNLSKQIHIIAANIDTAFILVTLKNPPTLPSFIDRFLATTQAYRIPSVILFNKIDTYNEIEMEEKNNLKAIYQKIGYTCIDISAENGMNVVQVKKLMQDKTTLFVGHSGVGKSTLINTIEPWLNLKTTAVSKAHNQGKHTTTFAEMFPLSFGGYIIDSPGIKGYGMVDFSKDEISHFFPEIFAIQSKCKYYNCIHLNEPKCAVIEAVEKGEIALSRYESYLQLLENDETYR
jgi:ribosome biogenesis GTPase